MKNAIISLIVFIGLLTSIFFLNRSILNLCDDIKIMANEIEMFLSANDKENSYLKALELMNYLEEKDLVTSVYVNHSDFDTMRYETARLCVYIETDDKREANASLHVIKYQAETVQHLQKIGIDNIF